jgi:aminoglycoside 3-N-acetyltransferase
MPALSYATVTREHPRFDLALTPSNVGMLAETFRRRNDVLRSLHPTHSVCAQGIAAATLLADHGVDHTPCGPHSPFHKLPAVHGKILMLGCGLRPNTSFHAIEEMVEPPYLFGAPARRELIDYELIDNDGRRTVKRYCPHDFAGYDQRYDRIEQMLGAPALRRGRVLDATVHLLDAGEMWRVALEALRRDPFAFVEATTPG